MSEETAIDRLRKFAKWARAQGYVKGEASFEAFCGLSVRYMYNLSEKGKGCIGSDKIALVANKFPMLNVRWLCTGIGNMINDETTASEHYQEAMQHIDSLKQLINRLTFNQ